MKREKSQRLADLISTFLPIIDMVEMNYDLDFAKECVHDMEKNSSHYDAASIVLPGGWNEKDAKKLRLLCMNLKAINDLVWVRRELKANAVRKAGEQAFHENFLRQVGLTT